MPLVRVGRDPSSAAGARVTLGQRAVQLDVEDLGDGRWRVTGGTEPHIVELDLRSGVPLCDCRGFKFRSRCRHVDAVHRFESGEAPDPASDGAAFVNHAGPGLERDVPPPDFDPSAP